MKLTARDPGIVREAEVTVTVGESVNVQKTSVEGETPLVSVSVSEAVHQSSTPTVQNAGTVTAQSVPSLSPSSSADTKGRPILLHDSLPLLDSLFCADVPLRN